MDKLGEESSMPWRTIVRKFTLPVCIAILMLIQVVVFREQYAGYSRVANEGWRLRLLRPESYLTDPHLEPTDVAQIPYSMQYSSLNVTLAMMRVILDVYDDLPRFAADHYTYFMQAATDSNGTVPKPIRLALKLGYTAAAAGTRGSAMATGGGEDANEHDYDVTPMNPWPLNVTDKDEQQRIFGDASTMRLTIDLRHFMLSPSRVCFDWRLVIDYRRLDVPARFEAMTSTLHFVCTDQPNPFSGMAFQLVVYVACVLLPLISLLAQRNSQTLRSDLRRIALLYRYFLGCGRCCCASAGGASVNGDDSENATVASSPSQSKTEYHQLSDGSADSNPSSLSSSSSSAFNQKVLSQGDDDDLTMNVVEDDAAEINQSHSWAVWRWFSVFTDLLIIFSAITAMARLVRNEVKDVFSMSLLVAWPSALAWMRLLEFASIIGPSYALYFNLISTAFPALFKFLTNTVLVMMGYGLFGTLYFGFLPSYIDLNATMATLFSIMHGDYIQSSFGETSVRPYISRLYYISFIFFFIYSGYNICLVIVKEVFHNYLQSSLYQESFSSHGHAHGHVHEFHHKHHGHDEDHDHHHDGDQEDCHEESPSALARLLPDKRIGGIDTHSDVQGVLALQPSPSIPLNALVFSSSSNPAASSSTPLLAHIHSQHHIPFRSFVLRDVLFRLLSGLARSGRPLAHVSVAHLAPAELEAFINSGEDPQFTARLRARVQELTRGGRRGRGISSEMNLVHTPPAVREALIGGGSRHSTRSGGMSMVNDEFKYNPHKAQADYDDSGDRFANDDDDVPVKVPRSFRQSKVNSIKEVDSAVLAAQPNQLQSLNQTALLSSSAPATSILRASMSGSNQLAPMPVQNVAWSSLIDCRVPDCVLCTVADVYEKHLQNLRTRVQSVMAQVLLIQQQQQQKQSQTSSP